jgi:2-keto-myo-inositol isomerase
MRFSLNHSIAPLIPIPEFVALAGEVGVDAVELRDGMPPGWVFPDSSNVLNHDPRDIARMASDAGVEILSINALQMFDQWDSEREQQARTMIDFAAAAGIGAVVLCPSVAPVGSPALPTGLPTALDGLQPILENASVRGLIEPLGFPRSSIRTQDVVEAEFNRRGNPSCFGIVHDSFHHAIARDPLYSTHISLVHLSGVPDLGLPFEELGDEHRVLVGPDDVLGNIDQVRQLMTVTEGPWSFEPFASEVGESPTLAQDLRASLAYVRDPIAD